MDEHDLLTPPNRTTSKADQLTGLDAGLGEAVSPVRVEVLADDRDPPEQDASPTLEALRRTIALAEERLNRENELRRAIEQRDQQLNDLQKVCEDLREQLTRAQHQLTEVELLQRQLQALLDQD